jgi:phosphopentomutase
MTAVPRVPRVAVIVCDSLGVGGAPDAARYGDEGANTLGNCARAVGGIDAPNLERLGLGMLTHVEGVAPRADPGSVHGTLAERSAGKDSTTGHWEIAGVVLDEPFPTYPNGFPPEVVGPWEEAIGRTALGNEPASGTEIIARLGEEHLRTGRPILYTSGDSVFQVATHVDVVPLETLYEWCRVARGLLRGPHRVGRVIARPFTGQPGAFLRTPDRRDYGVEPPAPTLLDDCMAAGIATFGVGKISDLFGGRGLLESSYSKSDDDGVDLTLEYLRRPGPSFVFTNLVDLDSKYGHRNDPDGYARQVERIDARIPGLLEALDEGVLFVTGDHGTDPTGSSTDHTRERTPVIGAGFAGPALDVGSRSSFADLGVTVADLLGVSTSSRAGTSFAESLRI